MRIIIKILFVALMLTLGQSQAQDQDPTSDELHELATNFAKCSGYFKSMIPVLEKTNNPAAAEQIKGQANGWMVASWMLFSAAHDPKGVKPYGTWEEMAESYSETGRSYMAFLLEQNDTKKAEELTASCLSVQDMQVELVEEFRKRAYADKALKD